MQLSNAITEARFIGMCDRYPSHLLPSGLFALLDNVLIENNMVSKRPGTTATTTAIASQDILGASAFEPNGASKQHIVCLNGASNAQLYNWNGSGAFSPLGSANLTKDEPMNFVQASNVLFGFNGTDCVTVDSALTTTKNPATVPKGKFGSWFHNYLFVAGTSGFPNRLYFSNLGTPTTFTNPDIAGGDWVDINANDGDVITGLAIFNDELYVFKNNTIWSVTGFSGTTFGATTIAGQNTNSRIYGYGTPSHQSIVVAGRDMYFLSFVGGVPHFRGFNQTVFGKTLDAGIISFDVEGTLKQLNEAKLSTVAGTYDGKRIFWAVPSSNSNINDTVLVARPDLQMESPLGTHRSWSKWTGITPSQFFLSTISGSSKIYFGDASKTGLVFQTFAGNFTDNGVAVQMDARTKDYLFDPNKKSKWKYMYIKIKTGSAGTLQVLSRVDQAANFDAQLNISLAGNSPGLGPTGTFTLGTSVLGGSATFKKRVTFEHMTGSLFGVQLLEQTVNSCDIYDYSILGLLKGLRDD